MPDFSLLSDPQKSQKENLPIVCKGVLLICCVASEVLLPIFRAARDVLRPLFRVACKVLFLLVSMIRRGQSEGQQNKLQTGGAARTLKPTCIMGAFIQPGPFVERSGLKYKDQPDVRRRGWAKGSVIAPAKQREAAEDKLK